MAEPSRNTSRSNSAPSSVTSDRQSSRAASQSLPLGAYGRPSMYANVVSSGAIIPAFAPASIDMLQIVIRPSIERERIDDPRYSTIEPAPPPVPPSPPISPLHSPAPTPSSHS